MEKNKFVLKCFLGHFECFKQLFFLVENWPILTPPPLGMVWYGMVLGGSDSRHLCLPVGLKAPWSGLSTVYPKVHRDRPLNWWQCNTSIWVQCQLPRLGLMVTPRNILLKESDQENGQWMNGINDMKEWIKWMKWNTWHEGVIEMGEMNKMNEMDGMDGMSGMNGISWMNEMHEWYEWIRWMDWDEWNEMNGMRWMEWDEWNEMNGMRWMNEMNELDESMRWIN